MHTKCSPSVAVFIELFGQYNCGQTISNTNSKAYTFPSRPTKQRGTTNTHKNRLNSPLTISANAKYTIKANGAQCSIKKSILVLQHNEGSNRLSIELKIIRFSDVS